MPMVCEVCGSEEEAEGAALQAHLHICANCRKDRLASQTKGTQEEIIPGA